MISSIEIYKDLKALLKILYEIIGCIVLSMDREATDAISEKKKNLKMLGYFLRNLRCLNVK